MRVKKLVGIVTGSTEGDHELAIKDGWRIAQAIQEQGKYDACLVEVVGNQAPWKLHKGADVAEIDRNTFQAVIQNMKVKPEVVLIQARGGLGENGDLQEYFDSLGVPFSNSGCFQTRDVYDKYECINTLRKAEIPVSRSILLTETTLPSQDDIVLKVKKQIGFPCFVKPNHGSKCRGISKVHSSEELYPAVETALQFDSQVFIESAVTNGTEVTCTVHDITMDDMLEALPTSEINHSGEYFHSQETQPNAVISTPTKTVRGEVVAEVVKIAKVAYRTLKLSGLASFDFIIQDELPILLEINPVPVLGPASLVERQVSAGLSMQWQRSMPKFYTILVDHAIKTFPLIRKKNQKKDDSKKI